MTVLDEHRLAGVSIIVTGDLVSDASSYTTGETVAVDGGYTVR
jgi:enoyl-[acyl-carrier-protein] reductase (NADH)